MSNELHPTMAAPIAPDRLQVPGKPPHPRRPPAQASVSLRHALASARANKGSPSPTSSARKERLSSNGTDSPSSLRPLMGRGSSGESSNAEQWFDKSNNEVREREGSIGGSEPPFFMRNSSSLETPPDGLQQSSGPGHVSDSLPLRTELLQLGTDGSGTDDFRSVIDDLTVQNKKLKRRLKKYEQLHDAHLKDEKLFEVRIHGLPSEKKRELEDMLRKFASSLGTTGDNAFPTDGYNTLLPMLNKEMTQATAHQSDSAYASMSLSGPGSSAVSASDRKSKLTPPGHLSARQKNIHSYLHDIPTGLLPQAPANMTERAKKKLVVRKVEQLFVGKGAVGGHQQPLQQQEVSQSAAQADRSARAAAGQSARAYGAREAQMLSRKKPINDKDTSSDEAPAPVHEQNKSSGKTPNTDRTDTEQRPTQPIDLDPDRAQVPQENIRYMRSMGFSPQHPDSAPHDGHGWIYINFLFNMAQLHTLHVTTEFVRDAMSDISTKLEVSPDGRKIRWRGGRSLTRTGSSGDGTPETGNNSSDVVDGQSPRKRQKLMPGRAGNPSAAGGPSSRAKGSNKHMYTPMFHHRSSEDDSEDSSSEEEEDTNESSEQQRWETLGDSSGVTSSAMQSGTPFNIAGRKRKKAKHDDGPIIFYNNARFCTDLSGERRPMFGNQNVPVYTTSAAYPVGGNRDVDGAAEGRGPLAEADVLPEAMEIDDNPTDAVQELSFLPHSPFRQAHGQGEQEPIDLEVTGIGGVWPEDNFMLNVETRHAHVQTDENTTTSSREAVEALHPRLAEMLSNSATRRDSRAKIGHEITDVKVHQLPPSDLPPALGFMASDDETSDTDSDNADHTDPLSPGGPNTLPPQISTQPLDFNHASDADDSDVDSDEDSDDGEVDLLANIREANPEFVRAQEREYDANMAERLAEEIPMGSSAATAGGGSGFASPASGAGRRDGVRHARDALGAKVPATIVKEDTGSSMAVEGVRGSEGGCGDGTDDSDDDDEMSDVGS